VDDPADTPESTGPSSVGADDQTAEHVQRSGSGPTRVAPRIPDSIPERIGGYRLRRVIATGGMGTVYEAAQDHPRRTVALKVMKAGLTSASATRRFEYESQLLARLRHPGIA